MSAEVPVTGGFLVEGYDYAFSRCDPGTGAHVDPAWCAIYETSTVRGPGGGLDPMLAAGWSSQDLSSWRFPIRPGARFHSGAIADARAVAAAMRLHSDPVASPINAFFWKNVRDIEIDGDAVVLRLHEPAVAPPRLLRSWHTGIHNQAERDRLGDEYGYVGADGTGPFRFQKIVPGKAFEVTRWEGFRGSGASFLRNHGPAYLDGVRWVPILPEGDRTTALEEGTVDCIQNASLLDVDRLCDNPELRVIEFQQSALVYLGLDHQAEELGFGDVRVRRAMSMAIDKDSLVGRELGGHAWAAHSPIPSQSRWYNPSVESLNRFDPGGAIELFDQAGLKPDAEGVRLRFEALVLEDSTVRRAARRISEMLRDVGVEVRLQEVAGFDAFYGRLSQHPEAFISKWFWPEPVDAIIGFISSWSHAGPNFQRASSPDIDAACHAWELALDEQQQLSAAHEIQRLSAEELPLIPLFFPAAVWAHHRRVHGWQPNVNDLYPLYNDVWLERG